MASNIENKSSSIFYNYMECNTVEEFSELGNFYIDDVNLCEIKSIADLEKLFMLKEKTICESEKKCEHSI